MSPHDVAKIGYEGMIKEELFVIPDGLNKAMIAVRRILPVTTQARINEKQNEEVPPEDRKHQRGEKEQPPMGD